MSGTRKGIGRRAAPARGAATVAGLRGQRAPGLVNRALPCALAALLLVAGGWAYQTSLDAGFVFDDFLSVVQNPNVRTLTPLLRAMSAPHDTTLAGRPVASLSFALDFARSTIDPATGFSRGARTYHATNVAIHLAAALALFGVVRRTLLSGRFRKTFGGASTWLAFGTALAWAVHPLNTEAVTYLSQRVEALAGLFALLALYFAIADTEAGPARPRASDAKLTTLSPSRKLPRLREGAAVACYLLALGSKESSIAAPFVIAAWDYLFMGDVEEGWRQRVLTRRWPLYAALGAASLLLLATAPAARTRSVGFFLDGWTPWSYLLTQAGVVVHYLRLVAWPSPLILDPDWPMVRSIGQVIIPFVLLVGLFAWTAYGFARKQPASFVGVCVFALLAPTSSVLPVVTEVAAEHRMYLPLAAIVALLVVGGYAVARRAAASRRASRRGAVGVRAVAGLALLLASGTLAIQTRARNLDYANEETIWRDTIAKQPTNARARTALGADLVAAGRYPEALRELEASLALAPDRAETLSNLGAAEFALGDVDASVAHLERAVALRPEFSAAHRNLAAAYRARHQDALAIQHFRRVLDAEPNHIVALRDVALLLAVTGDDGARNGREALALAGRAAALTSRRDPAALTALAAALAELDRFDEAAATLREAMPLTAENPPLAAELARLERAYLEGRKIRR